MQNYFIQETWNYINGKNYTPYVELSLKFVGITLALRQDNKSGDPIFFLFLKKMSNDSA